MRRACAAALACFAVAALTGCDNGPPVSQTRNVGQFTRLEVSGDVSLNVALFNRPDPGVKVTAGSKAIDRPPPPVGGDRLRVSPQPPGPTNRPDPPRGRPLRLRVAAPS